MNNLIINFPNTEGLIRSLNKILQYKKSRASIKLNIIDYNKEITIDVILEVSTKTEVVIIDNIIRISYYLEERTEEKLKNMDDYIYNTILSYMLLAEDNNNDNSAVGIKDSVIINTYSFNSIVNFKY
jgi:hypothetical protein